MKTRRWSNRRGSFRSKSVRAQFGDHVRARRARLQYRKVFPIGLLARLERGTTRRSGQQPGGQQSEESGRQQMGAMEPVHDRIPPQENDGRWTILTHLSIGQCESHTRAVAGMAIRIAAARPGCPSCVYTTPRGSSHGRSIGNPANCARRGGSLPLKTCSFPQGRTLLCGWAAP